MTPSLTKFKFGDVVISSLGTVQIRIPLPNYSFLEIKVNVVPANFPLLLGLDVLDKDKLVANNVHNELLATHHCGSLPFIRKHEHLYHVKFEINPINQVRNFQAASPLQASNLRKLIEAMKRARPNQVAEAPRQLFEEISKACEPCQTFSARSHRFQVSLPPFNIDTTMKWHSN